MKNTLTHTHIHRLTPTLIRTSTHAQIHTRTRARACKNTHLIPLLTSIKTKCKLILHLLGMFHLHSLFARTRGSERECKRKRERQKERKRERERFVCLAHGMCLSMRACAFRDWGRGRAREIYLEHFFETFHASVGWRCIFFVCITVSSREHLQGYSRGCMYVCAYLCVRFNLCVLVFVFAYMYSLPHSCQTTYQNRTRNLSQNESTRGQVTLVCLFWCKLPHC